MNPTNPHTLGTNGHQVGSRGTRRRFRVEGSDLGAASEVRDDKYRQVELDEATDRPRYLG